MVGSKWEASFSTCTERSTFKWMRCPLNLITTQDGQISSAVWFLWLKCQFPSGMHHVKEIIFMARCTVGVFVYCDTNKWGVLINVIFMLSNKHNHVWCSVNHSGFIGLETLKSPRSKFKEVKENQPSTRTTEPEFVFLSFLLWQFSKQSRWPGTCPVSLA